MVVYATVILDASRAAAVALCVAAALGMVRFVGGWLMRSAREDFRDSIASVVRDEMASQTATLRGDHADLVQKVEEGFASAKNDRDAQAEHLDAMSHELTMNGGGTVKDSIVLHTRWLRQIAEELGIVLEGEDES